MVDIETGQILGASDWTSGFSVQKNRLKKRATGEYKYRAIQVGGIDPKTVKPQLLGDQSDLRVSRNGFRCIASHLFSKP